jgi:hypothetical protein
LRIDRELTEDEDENFERAAQLAIRLKKKNAAQKPPPHLLPTIQWYFPTMEEDEDESSESDFESDGSESDEEDIEDVDFVRVRQVTRHSESKAMTSISCAG